MEREGFAVDIAGDGEEGHALAMAYDYDAIILDLMIPKMDGLSLLQSIRRKGKKTHVLILSAKDQVQDLAKRKKMDIKELERWLSPNLGYDS